MKEFKEFVDDLVELEREIEKTKDNNNLRYDDLKYYLERLKELTNRFVRIVIKADSVASLLSSGNVVWLSENICLYYKEGKVMIKVTDWQKGYWAEAPLSMANRTALLNFIKKE
jgi:hypothetical protein